MMLQTPRLMLRELCAEDGPALNEIERDPRVTRYMAFDPQSPDQTRAYIEAAIRQQSDDPRRTYDLAIVLRNQRPDAASHPSGVLIGRCALNIERPEHHESALWYLLSPAHWGRGYAVEAVTALLQHAFGTLHLHRVWADCDPRNSPSCRVAARLGMILEGRLRENYFLKGEWCSSAVYGILESEWSACGGLNPLATAVRQLGEEPSTPSEGPKSEFRE